MSEIECGYCWRLENLSKEQREDPANARYSADLVIVDEVFTPAGERVAEFGEQVAGVRLDEWQRGWLLQWFRRHR